jgi:hypothetical protein
MNVSQLHRPWRLSTLGIQGVSAAEWSLPLHTLNFRGILQVPLQPGNSRNYVSQPSGELAEEAPGIYSADSPDKTCAYSACSKFNVMTAKDCPRGVLIRGRWLNGETVTGTVLEVTGLLYANEQAAVEANDYSDKANRIELTEFICQ